MVDAAYKNYGCKFLDSEVSDNFFCANRMDKADVLFDKPPILTQKKYMQNSNDINVNLVLNFDEEGIYCGGRNISYEAFKDAAEMYRDEICVLNNHMHLTIYDIWTGLLTDFSFNMSAKLDEL